MSLAILADAIATVTAGTSEWVGPAAKMALLVIAVVGEDWLQRNPNDLRRFFASKSMRKLLAKKGIELTINEHKQILVRRI